MNKRYIGNDTVKQALGTELVFDVFLMHEGQEVHFIVEPV